MSGTVVGTQGAENFRSRGNIVFVWENFGPMHDDRCRAVSRHFDGVVDVLGVEIVGKSSTYEWVNVAGNDFKKSTLFPGASVENIGFLQRIIAIFSACRTAKAKHVFLCHYERPETLITAIALRIFGVNVYVMNDSKYDDYNRDLWREIVKSFFYIPYCGGLASGVRSKDYLRFLGMRASRIQGVYNALSIARIQKLSGALPAPNGVGFFSRHFTIIARMVAKKNLVTAIKAYKIYVDSVSEARLLEICGSGELEPELREQVRRLDLERFVVFRGFIQAEAVCQTLTRTVALLLPSIEEQFGNVVLEAQALGVPVILSTNCGARDEIIRTGVNGFIVEPDNAAGMAFFMKLLASDEQLWSKMCAASSTFARLGDVGRFVSAVQQLIEPTSNNLEKEFTSPNLFP